VTSLKQLVLGRKDAADLSDTETELPPDLMTVNMGPSHPAMHGTVRIVLTVDGERIVKSDSSPATCTAASRRSRSTRRTRRCFRTPIASTTSRR